MLAYLQRIGRSLMVPIAVMPVAALFMRLGAPDILNLPFIAAAGAAILDNIALLFAIGIAIGLSDDHRGEAVLAAVVGYLVIIASTQALLMAEPPLGAGYAGGDDLVTGLSGNVLIGIAAGLIAVWTYNSFRKVRLPSVLSFFSGRRLVPILTSIFVLSITILLRFTWPPLWNGLSDFNTVLLGWGAYGTAVYGILNRALIPFGLHHVLNSYFWFGVGEYITATGEIVTGDIPRFLSGDPSAGPYQVGFYPIMMFGLVGAALAMIITARKSKRAKTLGILGSAALVSLVTGITEPLEFAFLFVAPLLFVIHALLTGASMLVTNMMGLRHGFGFSAGLIDYVLNFGLAERPVDLAIVGGVFFVIYFGVFYALIRLRDMKTPGREGAPEVTEADMEAVMLGISASDDDLTAQAKGFIHALGGAENIVRVESCPTRLRLTVADSSQVQSKQLQNLGAKGVIKPSKTAVQIVVGVEAEFIAGAMRDVLYADGAPREVAVEPAETRPSVLTQEDLLPGTTPPLHGVPYYGSANDPAIAASVNLMITALGGPDNILSARATATTRVRVEVKDAKLVDEDALRAAGASGVMTLDNTFHILLGMQASAYGEEMQIRLAEMEA